MKDDFDKCIFCRRYDSFEGCRAFMCNNKDGFEPNTNKIIERAKECGISVSDVIALANLVSKEG